MRGHGSRYTRKREEAILALLTHATVPEAARAVGVGERTLWKWLQVEEFQIAYRTAKGELVRQAMSRIQLALGEAVNVLSAVMGDTGAPAASRVSAARAVLDAAFKAVAAEDFELRLSKLEAELAGRNST